MRQWILAAALFLSACSQGSSTGPIKRAVAVVTPTGGNAVSGIVTFQETEGGVNISAEIFHLMPGDHGFHIHEYGDISSPEGSGCGGHYNPSGKKHGAPGSKMRHAGDLGNITADNTGVGRYDQTFQDLDLRDIVGRSVIVHEHADDFTSQPSGGAGARIGQGTIGIAR